MDTVRTRIEEKRFPAATGSTKAPGQTFGLYGLCILCTLLVAGCAAGPDFARPKPPDATQYTREKQPAETVRAEDQAQHFEEGAKIADDWWRLFNAPALDAVIRKAIKENANLQSALARLRQSRENLRAGYGVFFPQVDSSFSAARQKFSPAEFGSSAGSSIFNLFTLAGTISYTLDIFGGQRRTVENLAAQVDYQGQTARAAYLTLLGNIVNASIAQAAYRAQLEATEQLVAIQKDQLRITESQAQAGSIPYSNVLAVKAQLVATEATLPPLKKNLSQSLHLLTALAGSTPAEWAPPPLALTDLTLPADLPVTLPSEMVRRRPDILAAEAQLHGASANIGVATAALFPKLTLSGNYGQNANDITKLFESNANVWSMGASLAAPVFHGGSLWFQRRAAMETYQASLSDYKQVVINSFQQVADALRALEFDAQTVQAQSEALDTAEKSLRLVKINYEAGLANYLQILAADNQYQQAKIGLIQARALRLQDTSALFTALGGGWWNPPTTTAGK